jgi:hypothetical protein
MAIECSTSPHDVPPATAAAAGFFIAAFGISFSQNRQQAV